jgi:sugar phosphate isomerase/epimerase
MQLGFVSAILGDLTLEQVFAFAAQEGFGCVELMCWPPGKADRRYAGVCHLDIANFTDDRAGHVRELAREHGVAISGLGYYPNPLHPDVEHRRTVIEHLKKVIDAAPRVGVDVVNTFIGRDPHKTVDDNWPLVRQVWPEIVRHAEAAKVKIGIENCPMLYSKDEWPGGTNLPVAPGLWNQMFEILPSPNLGLNLDPSHLIWQFVDYARAARDFGKRLVHVHAKDTRLDLERLNQVGINGFGWHVAKLPGLGDVNWTAFCGALAEGGYRGPVCIEVEDRAYEGSLEDRKRALRQSKRFLEQFIS